MESDEIRELVRNTIEEEIKNNLEIELEAGGTGYISVTIKYRGEIVSNDYRYIKVDE